MLTKLLDISTCTPISQLPNTINYNNLAISEEFDNIYDKSTNVLTKSLYAPVGSVKAYNGEFTTLTLDHLILRNQEALSDVVKSTLKIADHNLLNGRYSTTDIAANMNINVNNTNYHFCHDASTIILPNFYLILQDGGIVMDSQYLTVYNVLEKLVDIIKTLGAQVRSQSTQASAASVMTLNSNIATTSNTTSAAKARTASTTNNTSTQTSNVITYPATYLSSTVAQLRRLNVPKMHINDLINGKRYTYTTVVDTNITITNTCDNALECTTAGVILNLNFKITTPGNQTFRILLDRAAKKYLVVEINRPELTRVQLICVSPYNSTTGTTWDLYNYSLPTNSSKLDIITE